MKFYVADKIGLRKIQELSPSWSMSTIRKAHAKIAKGGDLGRGGGSKARALTAAKVSAVEEVMAAHPRTSISDLARRVGLSRSTAYRALRTKLQMRAFKQVKHQGLKVVHAEARKAWCQRIMVRTTTRHFGKVRPLDLLDIVFTDEKLFRTQKTASSGQHRRFWAKTKLKKEATRQDPAASSYKVSKNRFTPGVMVCLGVSGRHGAMHPYFVTANTKINSDVYQDIMQSYYVPNIIASFGSLDNVAFLQDNAPSHGSASTTTWLKKQGVTVLALPPNSPDLNVLDYAIWGILDGMLDAMHPNGTKTEAQLRGAIVKACSMISHDTLVASVRQLRKRCALCIAADGGAFEHWL